MLDVVTNIARRIDMGVSTEQNVPKNKVAVTRPGGPRVAWHSEVQLSALKDAARKMRVQDENTKEPGSGLDNGGAKHVPEQSQKGTPDR